MTVGILLSAGAGTRFGGGKLLHHLADGVPLGVASLRRLRQALTDVVAVVRLGDESLRELFERENVDIVVCAQADQGMGHSLAAGVAHRAGANGWVVALADMPHIRVDTIALIAHTLEHQHGIVVPEFQGTRGHPVAFSSDYRDEMLGLSGDAGARTILQRYTERVTRIAVDDPGVLQDIDTMEDARRLS
ncbi:MAG: nucleotidyltransferase family protein [Betaproteobacteria bacterium]